MSLSYMAREAQPLLLRAGIVVLGFLGISIPALAHADIAVTEIMYNPSGSNTGHQWVEVTNTGSTSIDLGAKNIRLFDASGDHLIKAYGTGDTSLAPGVSVVIAQDPLTFLSDYAGYAGQLLKSSFILGTSGIVGLIQTDGTDGTVLDKVTYAAAQGAAGDGNSLQRTKAGRFIPGAPTPGTYPATPPAALIPQMKQIAPSQSSSRQGKESKKTSHTSKTVTSKTHEKGTVAPADSADAASAGALAASDSFGLPDFAFSIPKFSMPAAIQSFIPALSSGWFLVFLALLGFSAFSVGMIQRQYV